jgi:nucleoside-diphosphate-sugar epimerase
MILVTGGTGLLGGQLVFDLTLHEKVVRLLYRTEKKRSELERLFVLLDPVDGSKRFERLEWVQGDINDIPSLEEAFQGVTHVFHCAGLVSFNNQRHTELFKVNREGTANVVNTCLTSGVEKLCYVSSTAAIGGQATEVRTEKSAWKHGLTTSAYALSKYAAEREVWRAKEEGLDVVIVNPSVIFGAGNWNDSSLTIFKTVGNGLSFYTPGVNGFVDARDVSKIMIDLMQSNITGERFLCVGHVLPFREILDSIASHLGQASTMWRAPRFASELLWRLNWLVSLFTGKDPVFTRNSVKSAYSKVNFSNEKVTSALNMNFRSMSDTIAFTVKHQLLKTK